MTYTLSTVAGLFRFLARHLTSQAATQAVTNMMPIAPIAAPIFAGSSFLDISPTDVGSVVGDVANEVVAFVVCWVVLVVPVSVVSPIASSTTGAIARPILQVQHSRGRDRPRHTLLELPPLVRDTRVLQQRVDMDKEQPAHDI